MSRSCVLTLCTLTHKQYLFLQPPKNPGYASKMIKTLSFSKSRPCSSHKLSSTVHNDEQGDEKKKKMNRVSSLKTLISPNCVAVWLGCKLPANLWSERQLNNIQSTSGAVRSRALRRQPCSPSCVNNTVRAWKCLCCLPSLWDRHI